VFYKEQDWVDQNVLNYKYKYSIVAATSCACMISYYKIYLRL
jgi:hypothetical protein